MNEQSFRVCHVCRSSELGDVLFDIDETETSTDAKDGFESIPPNVFGTLEVQLDEPDFLNPNSYTSVHQILRNIGVRAG